MMCFVFRSRRTVKGKVRVARTWSGKFRLPDDPKPTTVALGVIDKQVAQEKLREIVRAVERERAGFGPSKTEQAAAKQSVEKCVREYIQIKRGEHCDEKYVRELELKLLRLMRECEWSTLHDITANSFEAWRARQPREEMSGKTLNEYRAAISGLCKWLEPRTGSNPMRSVRSVKALGDPRRKRRAFTPEELCQLVSVAGERGIVYLVAGFTGLRRGELVKIEWRDVHIDGTQPYISVRSSIAKNAKSVAQPLPPTIAAALRRCRRVDVGPHDLVFKRLMSDMNRFRADLAAAGIPYVDEKGEYADFHSLRKTFATELAKLRLPLRVTMELMRHSDPNLTTKIYTDAGMLPIWDAVGALPMFNDTQIDTPKLVASGQTASAPVPIEQSESNLLGADDETLSPSKSGSVPKSSKVEESAPCRNRTCNPLIKSQLLCQLS
jgi:integrase